MAIIGFDDFRDSLQRLGGVVAIAPEDEASLKSGAEALQALPRVTAAAIRRLIEGNPESIAVLALVLRLSREQLRGLTRQRFGTESYRRLAAEHAAELVKLLDGEFQLLEELKAQRVRRWSFSDVLVERYASRLRAAGSVGRGRRVEDLVEAVVRGLGLDYGMRTRFKGRASQTGPADLAIPGGGDDALIVCAIKGFDSTGSKLTDAATEVSRMAEIRLPTQFVFVVLDGLGWLRRQSDLRRIHGLFAGKSIDGLYSISQLGRFEADLREASRRIGLT